MGQDSAPYNRTESTKLPYMRVLVRVEMPLPRHSFAARCTATPTAVSRQLIDFLVEAAVCAEVYHFTCLLLSKEQLPKFCSSGWQI
jgi:hypothetical protein